LGKPLCEYIEPQKGFPPLGGGKRDGKNRPEANPNPPPKKKTGKLLLRESLNDILQHGETGKKTG